MKPQYLVLGFIAALAVAWPFLPPFTVTLLSYIGLYAMVALGLVMLTGVGGMTSFGQAAFVGLGAYATAWVCTSPTAAQWLSFLPVGLYPWVGLLLGLVVTALIAWGLGAVTLRLSGHYLPLGTIAWGLSLYYIFGNLDWLGGFTGVSNIPPLEVFGVSLAAPRLLGVVIWAVLLLAIWALSNLLDSREGRAIRALKSGRLMAESMGVDTAQQRIKVFVLAALLAAVSGWLYAHMQRFVNPTPFNLNIGIEYLFMAVVGAASLDQRQLPPVGEEVLKAEKVTKRFAGLVANNAVDMNVRAGEVHALIGPNGAGKSTFFNMISGVDDPTEGQISLMGKVMQGKPSRAFAALGLGRTFQHVRLLGDRSVLDNVALGAHRRGHKGWVASMLRTDRAEEAAVLSEAMRQIERCGLGDVAHTPAASLPLGQQRIVEIARALAGQPAVLLLDEPAAGLRHLEKQGLAKLLTQLRAEGLAILVVEHDMEFVMNLADRITVLEFGTVIAHGSPAQVQSDPRVIAAYLGGDI